MTEKLFTGTLNKNQKKKKINKQVDVKWGLRVSTLHEHVSMMCNVNVGAAFAFCLCR